jgi:hypothetical protein
MRYILSEKQFTRLNEILDMVGGDSPLYHHTSEKRALNIISDDSLKGSHPSPDYLIRDRRLAKSPTQKVVSFTRDKNFVPDESIGASFDFPEDLNVIFVLDRNKLRTKYKVEPFNYSYIDPNIEMNSPYKRGKENEERVLTSEIHPLHKYLIDIIYKGNNPYIQIELNTYLDSF